MLTALRPQIPVPDHDLITAWREQWRRLAKTTAPGESLFSWMARKAARWAADHELEVTLNQISAYQHLTSLQKESLITYLRHTRR